MTGTNVALSLFLVFLAASYGQVSFLPTNETMSTVWQSLLDTLFHSHGVFLLSVTLAYSQNTHSFAQVLMAFIKAEAFIKSTMLVSASILVSCLMESFLLVCSATSFTVLISAKGPLSS